MSVKTAKDYIALFRVKLPSVWAVGQLSIANVVVAVLMLLQMVVVTRTLSKEQFGVLGLALAWSAVASAILDFRVWEVLTIAIPRLRQDRRIRQASALVAGSFVLEIFGGICISLFLLLVSSYAGSLFAKNESSALVFAVLAIQPLVMSFDEPMRTMLRLGGRFAVLAWWRAGSALLQFALVLTLLLYSDTAVAVASAIVLSWVLRILVLAVFCRQTLIEMRLYPLAPSARSSIVPALRERKSMFIATMLSAVGARLTNRADILFLGLFTSPILVAPYDLARRLSSQVGLILHPLEQVIFPKISAQIADGSSLTPFIRGFTGLMVALTLPVSLAIYFVLPDLIIWCFGETYIDAILPTQLLLVSYFHFPFLWLRPYLMCRGEVTFISKASWGAALILTVSCLLFIPMSGATGAAVSVVITQWLWLLVLEARRRRLESQSSEVVSEDR